MKLVVRVETTHQTQSCQQAVCFHFKHIVRNIIEKRVQRQESIETERAEKALRNNYHEQKRPKGMTAAVFQDDDVNNGRHYRQHLCRHHLCLFEKHETCL